MEVWENLAQQVSEHVTVGAKLAVTGRLMQDRRAASLFASPLETPR